MANRHYTGTNTPQIKQLYPEWIYPDWMPPWEYREYQQRRTDSIRAAHDSVHQEAERHKRFLENAKKHNIPLKKKK